MRVLILALSLLAADPGDTVTVKREGARLMKAPRFFGAACPGAVRPGDRVRLLERRKGWARLAAPGAGACWLHETAWSDRTAGELSGGGATSARDVELAGRGFSEAEVSRLGAERPELARGLAAVDGHLERGGEAPPDELQAFLVEGELGGAR
jgi:hypothetical protein